MSTMRPEAASLARAQIADASNDYALGLDRQEIKRFLAAWHEDGKLDAGPRQAHGHAELESWAEEAWQRYRSTVHLVGNLRLEFDGTESASGLSGMSSQLLTASGELRLAAARYEDVYRCRDGVWRLQSRVIVVQHLVDIEAAKVTFGW